MFLQLSCMSGQDVPLNLHLEVAQSCPTLCDPVDCSPPGSSAHGILQARILEWVAISFSRGSSWPRDQTQVSCIAGRHFNLWATREAPRQMLFSVLQLFTSVWMKKCYTLKMDLCWICQAIANILKTKALECKGKRNKSNRASDLFFPIIYSSQSPIGDWYD